MAAEEDEIDAQARADGWTGPRDPSSHDRNGIHVVNGTNGNARRPPAHRRIRDIVPEIEAHAGDPTIPITIGGVEVVALELGGTAVLIAASKRGKTSWAMCSALEHARDRGPAIAMSLELPVRELAARTIGTRTETSWRGVLHGEVAHDRMIEVLPERLAVIDREHATLDTLLVAIEDMRQIYPGQPILVVIDYLQLLDSKERDARLRVDDVMRRIDMLARSAGVAVLALSQSARAASRQLGSGERIGVDAADAGAESAAIERWASAIIAIGQAGIAGDDGSCAVELSVAAQRMDAGDRVLPARYDGRTGRWRIVGDSQTAAAVREQREILKNERLDSTLEAALIGACRRNPEPLSRTKLLEQVSGNGGRKSAALKRLLAIGADIAEVMISVKKAKKNDRGWLVWAPDLASAKGIHLAPREVQMELA